MPASRSDLALHLDVAVDADRGRDPQACRSASIAGSYSVARSARCRVRMPTMRAVGVDDRRQPVPPVVQQVERILGVDAGREREQLATT